jgi:DNA-binding transcriptional LysR family regulator
VLSAYLLPPVLREIRSAHPGIELELVASNQVTDLHRREADIAIRGFRPTQPDLVALKIQDGFAHLYASPAYLAEIGDPQTPEDLSRAVFFGFDRTDTMVKGLGNVLGLSLSAANFPIVSSNHLVQWALAREGVGICMMMEEIGDGEPSVRRVLPDLPPFPVPMWLVTHREVRTSRRIRVIFDLLAEGLRRRCKGTCP